MIRAFTENGWEDYLFWEKEKRKTIDRINELLKDIERNGAAKGKGRPEPLHGDLSGYFSRRINEKDRLIYRVSDDKIIILSCHYHFSDH